MRPPATKWFSCVAVLAGSAVLLSACSSGSVRPAVAHDRSWSGRTILLGAIFSQTGAGDTYGPQQEKGAQLAAAQINADGGVRGARIQIMFDDDGSNPTTSATETRTLIAQDHVMALLGPTLSNAAVGAHPVANQLQTPMLAVSNTGPGIVGDCAYPCQWIFRDSLGEQTAIPVDIAADVASAHPRSAAVIYPSDDSFGVNDAVLGEQAFQGDGVPLQAVVPFPSTTTDLGSFVSQAIAGHPDVLLITGSSGALAAQIMALARRQDGYLGQFLGGNAFNSVSTSQQAGVAGQGAQSAAAWYLGNVFPANTTFVTAYENAYGADPDQFAAQAYTGVELLAAAAGAAPLSFTDVAQDRARLASALESVRMETPLGPFSFTPDHDVNQPIWIVDMDGEGAYSLVTSELAPAPTS